MALNSFLKRKNAKNPFVELTIERVGYPYCDKAQFRKAPALTGRGTTDSVLYTYIPFVLETETVVDATLIVRTYDGDTATKWVCDWQYYNLAHGSVLTSGTAEEMSAFFIQLQYTTFGDTLFTITDSTLFGSTLSPNWASGGRKAKIVTSEGEG